MRTTAIFVVQVQRESLAETQERGATSIPIRLNLAAKNDLHPRKMRIDHASQKITDRHSQGVTTGYVSRSDLSAAKWSRWEKRESLSVLLHKPLSDSGEP